MGNNSTIDDSERSIAAALESNAIESALEIARNNEFWMAYDRDCSLIDYFEVAAEKYINRLRGFGQHGVCFTRRRIIPQSENE